MTEQRKLAAVMFTDIAGYTALMSKDEQKALALLEKNRELQKSLAKKHNGEFLKEMGDGTLLCFQSALDAVRCAMEIQESVNDDPDLNLRIGIHLGDIVFKDGDVFGDGVNVASRIEALAEVGGICISEQIYLLIRNQPKLNTVFVGEKKLKNVSHPIKIYAIAGKGERSHQPEFQIQEKDKSQEKSIIVLPFDDMSPSKDNEYFSDGLTEEIITDLSHVNGLLVISRSSAMTFKGTKKTIPEIAKSVNVRYVLEGSVRKAGNNLRITAQLIDATTDVHLWAEKYSGTLDDVFDIQEKVSRRIVDALKIKLSSEEKQKITTRPIENVDAYVCYLRARYEALRWTEEGMDNALKHLQNGLEIAGENAVITAELGYVYYQYINMGLKEDDLYLQKAEEFARHALELDPETVNGYIVLGLIKATWGGNMKEGIKYLRKALNIRHNDYDATYWLIAFYAHAGQINIVNPYVEKLKLYDPLNPWSQWAPGFVHMWDGQFDLALKLHEKIFGLYPYITPFRWYYAFNLAYSHRIDEACSHFEGAAKEQPNAKFFRLGLLLALALKGKKQEVKAVLNDGKLEAWAKNDFSYSYYVADSYALIDEKEKALDWLEIAVNRGLINYPFINEYDPFLENIRGEPRFKKLMKRVKYEWENFEV